MIVYLPDPRDNNNMQPVVTLHARFTGDLHKAIVVNKEAQKNLISSIIKMTMKLKSFS